MIIIPDKKKLDILKNSISKQGKDRIHVLADFDGTLTYAYLRNKETPSIISVLRNGNYLNSEYAKKAHEFYAKYHPIEINPHISEKEKKEKMLEWWTLHFDLLIKSGLNKKDLEKIVKEGAIKLRKGGKKFFKTLNQQNVPIVIMSSSGVGDTIPIYLQQQKIFYPNIHLITNSFEYNSEGRAIKPRKPIIHSMNKDETSIKSLPDFKKIKQRKNVLLLGNNLGDLGMIKGFDYLHLIKIGFFNEKPECADYDKQLESFKDNFDLIILNDKDFTPINKLLSSIF